MCQKFTFTPYNQCCDLTDTFMCSAWNVPSVSVIGKTKLVLISDKSYFTDFPPILLIFFIVFYVEFCAILQVF